MLRAWKPNTLPLPCVLASEPKSTQPPVSNQPEAIIPQVVLDVDDNFPKGQVIKYFPNQGYGFIRGNNGREFYFNLNELDFAGIKGKETLKTGVPVGYDISHTSHGLHVKKLKIY